MPVSLLRGFNFDLFARGKYLENATLRFTHQNCYDNDSEVSERFAFIIP